MKLLKTFLVCLLLGLTLTGCRAKIQSDLTLENARFTVSEAGKAQFIGSVKNIGKSTYKSVFIVVDGYEGDTKAVRVSTSADLFSGRTLGPGESTSFSKDYEDGGYKPTRYEVVRLYGLK